ncbi:MAG: SMC-Scp complex subunit ScpB [bacterium]|nr:SMC-Scp complex subunit ScpB [bacterium]
MELSAKIESLLFIAGKPLAFKRIAMLTSVRSVDEIKKTVQLMSEQYYHQKRGIQIILTEEKAQIVTSSELNELAEKFVKDEMTGELTRPSIETLTIIAYRGPITKLELERIRGINCSLILRNLQIRGLIEEKKDAKQRQSYFNITIEFLKHLGINSVNDLPDYEKLHKNEDIDKFLAGEA